MKIELHPEAETELFGEAVWYDDQVPGLGDDLLIELGQWLDIIAESPLAWPKWPEARTFDPPAALHPSRRDPSGLRSRS